MNYDYLKRDTPTISSKLTKELKKKAIPVHGNSLRTRDMYLNKLGFYEDTHPREFILRIVQLFYPNLKLFGDEVKSVKSIFFTTFGFDLNVLDGFVENTNTQVSLIANLD